MYCILPSWSFLTSQTNVRNLEVQMVPRHHQAIIIIFIKFAFLRMSVWMIGVFWLYVRFVSMEILALSWSHIQEDPPCTCVVIKEWMYMWSREYPPLTGRGSVSPVWHASCENVPTSRGNKTQMEWHHAYIGLINTTFIFKFKFKF